MRMRSREIENTAERLICVGLIVSDRVIAQLAPIMKSEMFTATYTRQICRWCLEFFQKFEKSPKSHIQNVFEAAKRDYLQEDVADLIETLLISLNGELEENESRFNEDYVLEEAEKYIKSRKAQMLCEDVSALLSKGQILEAEGMLAGYSIPKRPQAEGDDIFTAEFWVEEEKEIRELFSLPGALGELVGPIERDSFVAVLATEKMGKTWWLMEFALRAYRNRCNVVFFSCGDMTKNQMRSRFRHMLTAKDSRHAKETVLMPILDCLHNQKGQCPLDEETDPILLGGKGKERKLGRFEDFPEHIPCAKCADDHKRKRHYFGRPWYEEKEVKDISKDLESVRKIILKRAKNKRFRLFCFPPSTVSVSSIKAHLDILQQQENFLPDIVVIDYADILAPEPKAGKLEYRHQINDTWMALRRLSQERNCAVLTATQAKAAAMKSSQVKQWDAGEDKRKLAHVTAMLALNQTPQEKRDQVMRVSNIAVRDRDFDTERNVQVLQCLEAGRPIVYSYLHKAIPKTTTKKEVEDAHDN